MNLFVLKALMFCIWQEKLPEPTCSQLSNRQFELEPAATYREDAVEECALLAANKIIREGEASRFFVTLYLLHLINLN